MEKFLMVGMGLVLLGIATRILFIFNVNSSNENTHLVQLGVVDISPVTLSPTPKATMTPSPTPASYYPVHKNVYATMFWVGEDASEANDYIPNQSSAWDSHWLENYGGIDNPYTRVGYYPKGFKPKENPFYVALPYNEFDEFGRKQSAYSIPWYYPGHSEYYSFLKNRWIRVQYKNQTCYGQWEDVGPFENDDFEYVFGNNSPKNNRAGIDLSPALRHCLKMATNDHVEWQFMEEKDVPAGPWKEVVTDSPVNWQ